MKKTVFTIALMALLLISTSAYNQEDQGIRKGDNAQSLVIENAEQSFDLAKMKGSYVLLTFWSSTDAQSRIDCNKYVSWKEANPASNVKHVSINFDTEKVLFDEIVLRDGLDENAQFNVQGSDAAGIVKDFRLANGFGSMLIDPQGKVVAINPSTSSLTSLS